jgi:hypothetical protein
MKVPTEETAATPGIPTATKRAANAGGALGGDCANAEFQGAATHSDKTARPSSFFINASSTGWSTHSRASSPSAAAHEPIGGEASVDREPSVMPVGRLLSTAVDRVPI